ncbi:hypothetical protein [Massilia sp. Dwa41.01b]|nr:hypothetical protein [Massilia sp. Dwa41.01b]
MANPSARATSATSSSTERVVQMRDDISRTERNIEALRREIANIR